MHACHVAEPVALVGGVQLLGAVEVAVDLALQRAVLAPQPLLALLHLAVGVVAQLHDPGDAVLEERGDHVVDGVRGVGAQALQGQRGASPG